jgi:hypothetical protein
VDVDDLVGLELAGEGEDVTDVATLGDGDACGGNGGCAGVAAVVALRVAGTEMDGSEGHHDNRSTGGENHGCGSCVIRMHCEAYS